MDANLRGQDGDATDEEKIQTTATEKEKEKERVMKRMAVARGGVGANTTMKVVVEATTIAGGRDDCDDGNDGDGDNDDPTERL